MTFHGKVGRKTDAKKFTFPRESRKVKTISDIRNGFIPKFFIT